MTPTEIADALDTAAATATTLAHDIRNLRSPGYSGLPHDALTEVEVARLHGLADVLDPIMRPALALGAFDTDHASDSAPQPFHPSFPPAPSIVKDELFLSEKIGDRSVDPPMTEAVDPPSAKASKKSKGDQ